jgi:hypothetical protein
MSFFNRHIHLWFMVSAKPGSSWGSDYTGPHAVTLILHRCSVCGDTKVTSMRGIWTLEEISGGSNEH